MIGSRVKDLLPLFYTLKEGEKQQYYPLEKIELPELS
jgi:hypothetical protein